MQYSEAVPLVISFWEGGKSRKGETEEGREGEREREEEEEGKEEGRGNF